MPSRTLRVLLVIISLALLVGVIGYFVPLQKLSGSLIEQIQPQTEVASCTGTAQAWFILSKYLSYPPAVAKAEECVKKASDTCAMLTSPFQGAPSTFTRYASNGLTPLAAGSSAEYAWSWKKFPLSYTEESTVTTYFACKGVPADKLMTPPKQVLSSMDECADPKVNPTCTENKASWLGYGTCAAGYKCSMGSAGTPDNAVKCYCYKTSSSSSSSSTTSSARGTASSTGIPAPVAP